MKYLSVKLDDTVDLDAFKAKAQKEAVEAEAKKAAAAEPPKTEETEAPAEEVAEEPQNSAEEVPETPASVSSTEEEGE